MPDAAPATPQDPRDALRRERVLVGLIGAVQFVNILDFVMVMPLGPDFARGLGVPQSNVGIIGGAYALAACVAGLVGGTFLDRFDRRRALAVAMAGLVVGTAVGGFATGLPGLVAARLLAGAFGGPATSLAMSLLADEVPAERRGRALGAVMGALSVAQVLGVPAALWVAERAGWRAPFFAVAGLGALVVAGALAAMPRARHAPVRGGPPVRALALVARPEVRLSYTLTAVVMAAGFLIIPAIPAYIQNNLGFPRAHLGWLYGLSGAVSFGTLRLGGWLVDRHGSARVVAVGTAVLVTVLLVGFGPLPYPAWLPVPVLFLFFGFSLGLRNVAYNTLTSKVPEGPVRARFMSLQSAVQHAASSAGALGSSLLLTDLPDGRLGGMASLALTSVGLGVLVPLLVTRLERRVRARAG